MTPNAGHAFFSGKRILIVSALFPPDVIGGAETCAYNLGKYLSDAGAVIGIYTTAKSMSEQTSGEQNGQMFIWRRSLPRLYPMMAFQSAPAWKKVLWHLQDHFDPRNKQVFQQVVDEFKPDAICIHILQGIGYNSLKVLKKTNIPVVYFLHDLGLACVRMAMFRNGKNCKRQCALCQVSAHFKCHYLKQVGSLAFSASSAANLSKISEYIPVTNWLTSVNLDVHDYPKPTESIRRYDSPDLRLLYAGRLHKSKGVDLLIAAVEACVLAGVKVSLTIAGDGPERERLQFKYGGREWISFKGFISQQQLSNLLCQSDAICVPSVWAENSPGVIIHALSLGVPVIASRNGGIPELVKHLENGFLVPHCSTEAWRDAIVHLVNNTELLTQIKAHAANHQKEFSRTNLGAQVARYLQRVIERLTIR